MKKQLFKKYFICLTLLASCTAAFSQTDDNNLIQFSGVVVNRDSLHPIPFSNVMIKGTYRGTISDYYGFFSFVARLNDTIEFSSIGYRRNFYIIPDSLKENRYSLIQVLIPDTFQIKEVVIFPWPSKEQFKQAFLNARPPCNPLAVHSRWLARFRFRSWCRRSTRWRCSRSFTAAWLPCSTRCPRQARSSSSTMAAGTARSI